MLPLAAPNLVWRRRSQPSTPVSKPGSGDAFLHALAAMTPGQSLALPKNLDFHWVRAWGELRNLYDIAWLILNSAALRTESRGGHFREDHPHTDPQWRVHTLVKREHWEKSEPLEGEE